MVPTFRLFQLISPSLPVGAFAYSQGLEWAVESGWINDQASFDGWLRSQLTECITQLELPMLNAACGAIEGQDWQRLQDISRTLIAWRETKELRQEEQLRGEALMRLLPSLGIIVPDIIRSAAHRSQVVGLAIAGGQWHIQTEDLCRGYVWSWLENAVITGVKLIPLGQTQGQQILHGMSSALEKAVQSAAAIAYEDAGSSAPALAIASSNHEIQYTRLFRS